MSAPESRPIVTERDPSFWQRILGGDSWSPALLLGIGIAGAGAMLYSTAVAPWVFTDAVAYLLSAENFAHGRGLGLWPLPSVWWLAAASGAYIVFYPSLIAVVYLFMDPKPDIDARTLLAPVVVPLWIWWLSLPLLGLHVWPRARSRAATGLVVLLVGALAFLPPSLDLMRRLHQDGDGYTSRTWASSGVIEAVKELSSDVPLISNESAAVHFLTRRPAYDLPELMALQRRPLDARFGDDFDDPIERVFRQQGGALVLFDTVFWQLDPIHREATGERLRGMTAGLDVVEDTWDGAVLVYPEEP